MIKIMYFVKVFNVCVDNISTEELLERLNRLGGFVVTPNVDHLIKLQKDLEFLKAYRLADYKVCDSKILQYAAKFLGTPIPEKISGSDFFPIFCEYNKNNQDVKVFLLGGLEGVPEKAKEELNQKIGREIIVDCYSPPFGFEKDEQLCQEIIEKINRSDATVLGVGLGAPKQEKWIAKYKKQLKNIKIFLAIGAAIDFEAGNKPRSPKWMSEVGLEWFYRLISEPKRLWKRYLVESLPFFWLTLKQRLNLYHMSPIEEVYALPPGELLQHIGLLDNSQIAKVLQAQKEEFSALQFGEILDKWGWVKKETVDFIIEEFPPLLTSQKPIQFQDFLTKAKLLNEEEIKAIAQQETATGLTFAEIALQRGFIKQKTLEWFASLQSAK